MESAAERDQSQAPWLAHFMRRGVPGGETMRIATLYGPRDFRLEEWDKPQITADDGVLVRLRAVALCGTNIHYWEGFGQIGPGIPVAYPLPGGFGHEFAGKVVAVGPRVTRVQVGDRVALDPSEGSACGSCFYCAMGKTNHCEQPRHSSLFGFVEYMTSYERGLYKLPDHVSTDEGSMLSAIACSVHGVRRALTPGDTVAVLGSGRLGLFAVAAAKHLGASKVIATYKYDFQAQMAEACGADVVLRGTEAGVEEKIREQAGGRGPDVVVETVGGWANTIQQATDVVRNYGTVVVLGTFNDKVPVDTWQAMYKDVAYVFSYINCRQGSRTDLDLALEMVAKGKLPSKEMVSHRFPLEEIQAAFELMTRKDAGPQKAMQVVINP